MEQAFEVLAEDEPDADIAAARWSGLGGAYVFLGDLEPCGRVRSSGRARSRSRSGSAQVLAPAFNNRSLVAQAKGRPEESVAFLEQALAIGAGARAGATLERLLLHPLRPRVPPRSLRGGPRSPRGGARARRAARALARTSGACLAETTYALYMLGRWDDALSAGAGIPEERLEEAVTLSLLRLLLEIQLAPRRAGRGPPAVLALPGPARDSKRRPGARLHGSALSPRSAGPRVRTRRRSRPALRDGGTRQRDVRHHQPEDQARARPRGGGRACSGSERAGRGAPRARSTSRPPGLRSPFLEAQARPFPRASRR